MLRWKRYALCGALCLLLALTLSACALVKGVFKSNDESEEPVNSTAGFRQTVLYFQTDDGLMVPVMKLLPWEEGIGRAALNQLVDNDDNRISAAAMGLKSVVPKGVSFVLSIAKDAVATVNIIDMPKLESAQAEQAMVTAVVNTLEKFSAIDRVQLKFDGKVKSKLAHGTKVGEIMSPIPLNPEPLPVSASEEDYAYKVTLYYPNQAGSLNVPVTRSVTQEPDITLAMQELVKGPADAALRNCFPEGTEVLSAAILDDVATVNLSKQFAALQKEPDMEELALTCMELTAQQFGASISELRVQVEGKALKDNAAATMAMPKFVNEFRSN